MEFMEYQKGGLINLIYFWKPIKASAHPQMTNDEKLEFSSPKCASFTFSDGGKLKHFYVGTGA